MIEILTTALFLAYIGYREWQHGVHVKRLENKAISKDTEDYARLQHIDKAIKPAKPLADPEDDFDNPENVDVSEALKGIDRG